MAEAWDPMTGASVGASDIAALLAAADARAGGLSELPQVGAEHLGVARTHDIRDHATAPPGPDVLFVKLVDGMGETCGQFTSKDKHAAASRVCSFLQQAPANGRVTIECGTWSAIALRHPNGLACHASYTQRTSAQTPAVLSYSFDAIAGWALGICSLFLFNYHNEVATQRILDVAHQRKLSTIAATAEDAVLNGHASAWYHQGVCRHDALVQETPQTSHLATGMHARHTNVMFA